MSVVSGDIRPRRGAERGRGNPLLERVRSRRAGRVIGGLALLAGAGVFTHHMLAPGLFPVRTVRFIGHFPRVPRDRLVAVIAPYMHENFYALDLTAVATAVHAVPWAAGVSVTRRFPRTLDISLHDQQLVGQWANGGFVNAKGAQVRLGGYARPANLPLFAGPEGAEQQMEKRYQHFNAILSPLSLTITRLSLSARQSWRVTLGDGVTVMLGRHPDSRLMRLVAIFPQLAPQIPRMRRIDLRYTNGFAVSWRKAPGDTHG